MNYIISLIQTFWSLISVMSPYLLLGFLVSGILHVVVPPGFVEKHLGGKGIRQILKASIFGVPVPLCSCGVIPVSASLLKSGAGKGAATAFLLSTPQTGVDSIAATFSLLGPVFAVFRPLAALVTGVVGGILVDRADADGSEKVAVAGGDSRCCCSSGGNGRRKALSGILNYGFVTMPGEIGKPVIAGIFIAGLITLLVPDGFFVETVGTGIGAMLLMMAAGIPMYVCATASVPVAAAMILKGVSPGAALVFLMTGPATNAAALATVWRVFGRRTAVIYLSTVAGCALLFGFALDMFFSVTGIQALHPGHHMLPGWFGNVCGVILAFILVNALLFRKTIQTGTKEKEI